jgi:hypothetical protein
MYKFQNHIEVLKAIQELRETLPTHANSSTGQIEAMSKLATIYACLDVNELTQILQDFKSMNRRSTKRVSFRSKVA